MLYWLLINPFWDVYLTVVFSQYQQLKNKTKTKKQHKKQRQEFGTVVTIEINICCMYFLVQPGRSPGIEMYLSAPGIYNVNNILSCTLKQCCISFLVQSGRSPGIQMCLSAPGIYKTNNILSCSFKQCCIPFLVLAKQESWH